MTQINWDEYKTYKKQSAKDDNFIILLDFIRSYYNTTNEAHIYDILVDDELSQMMLDKRDIKTPEDLEKYLYTSAM
ncbi:MAG: hypothetical protein U9N33_02650 [Campylobacterota bacterium]|nr:hypothetical protein [Campylobacterota bacterium]